MPRHNTAKPHNTYETVRYPPTKSRAQRITNVNTPPRTIFEAGFLVDGEGVLRTTRDDASIMQPSRRKKNHSKSHQFRLRVPASPYGMFWRKPGLKLSCAVFVSQSATVRDLNLCFSCRFFCRPLTFSPLPIVVGPRGIDPFTPR